MLVNIGPAAPSDPRRAPARGRARGRDREALYPSRRLPALRLREAGRVPPLQPDHPPHRPHRLPLADGQQRGPRAGGREADGDRDDRAVPGAPGDRLRDEPHHLPPGVARHHRHRSGRVHPVPLVVPGAGADLQPPGDVDRRPAHHQHDPGRRPHGRRARRLRRGSPRVHPHLPRDPARGGHHVHPQRDLDRPDAGRRRAHGGGGDQLLALRPDAPGERRGLRRPQGPPLPRLRDLRFRRADRRARRRLRSLPGAARGDVAVQPDSGAGARSTGAARGRARSTWTIPGSSCRPSRRP